MMKAIAKWAISRFVWLLPDWLRRYIYSAIQAGAQPAALRHQFERLLNDAVSASNSGDHEVAEDSLRKAAALCPDDPRVGPHLGRVRFLRSRSRDAEVERTTRSMLATLDSMDREIKSDPIYVPSNFWTKHGRFHVELLERYGIENFKRTVSHHYQNWYMISRDDPQVRQLFRTWPTHLSLEPWYNTIEVPDHVGMHSFTFENPVNPLASPEEREIYRIAVGLLWEFVKRTDKFDILDRLTESELGNPIRIWRRGRLISSDVAHSVRERNMLLEGLSLSGNENLVVAEIGAGHGRLAEVFANTTNYRYFIFDITPALFVSQWYIKALFPKEKVFQFRHFDEFAEIRDELGECRFAFFTANQIEKLPPDSLDLFINMNSLMEMQIDQILNFLRHIDRLSKVAFLSRQRQNWVNRLDHRTVSKDTFSMPERWRLILDKVDDIHPDYFNQLWRRQP